MSSEISKIRHEVLNHDDWHQAWSWTFSWPAGPWKPMPRTQMACTPELAALPSAGLGFSDPVPNQLHALGSDSSLPSPLDLSPLLWGGSAWYISGSWILH